MGELLQHFLFIAGGIPIDIDAVHFMVELLQRFFLADVLPIDTDEVHEKGELPLPIDLGGLPRLDLVVFWVTDPPEAALRPEELDLFVTLADFWVTDPDAPLWL